VASDSARSYVCPVLIGRADAAATLCRSIDEAAGGAGRTAAIVGDAGLGKSRLLRSVRPYAEERGFLIVEGTCFPQDRTEPYAPFADALRARFAGQPPEAILSACGPFAGELHALLPDLFPSPSGTVAALQHDQERRRVFAALTHCLLDQAGSRPLLLAVEDLHWCDEASLDFLFYLARRVKDRPFLLLTTYRGDEVTPHLRAWLAQMEREGLIEEVPLVPLARDEVEAMIRATLGPHPVIPAGPLHTLADLAEGNPFYVEELLTSLVAAGEPVTSEPPQGTGRVWNLALPRSMHAAVYQRVERLSPDARQVLQLAAVVGRRFDFELLLHLAELDEPALIAILEELVAARLVTEESGERFAFRHALTRQAVYAELLARTRALLHRRVGEAAERIYATALDQHLGDLAEHFYRAEVWDKAQAYARLAGDRALRLSALRTATEHFARALEANRRLVRLEEVDETDALLLTLTAAATYRGRGRAYHQQGDFDRAQADYEAATDRARTAGDAQEECLGLLDSGVLWASRDYARAGEYFRGALELAREMEDPGLLADCLNRLGNWYANSPEPWEAAPLHREALDIVERIGCRAGVATTLDWLGTASYLCGDLAESAGYFERAADLFRALDDRPLLASCLTMLATRAGSYVMHSMDADATCVAAAVRDGEEALALARAIGSPAAEAFALIQSANIQGPRGEYGRALELATRALEVAEAIAHGQWTVGSHCALGALYLDLLVPEEARRHMERALALARGLSSTYWTQRAMAGLALACLQLHEPDRAAAILAELPHITGPVRSLGEWWVTYARAQLALSRRDTALALRLCDQLRAPEAGVKPDGESPLLVRLRAEALTALATKGAGGRGQIEEVEMALLAARGAMRRQGTQSELWRIHAALGNLNRIQGRDEDARREFAAARAIIEEITANVTDEHLRNHFLQNATALLPRAYRLSPLSSAAARFGGLTAREREVATLIARGRSNREIAAALVLGKRTVETHVGNILTKLGATTRQEIAAWAIAQGLAPDTQDQAA
jgi:DNA-binding NarL/FixJ family response regulator